MNRRVASRPTRPLLLILAGLLIALSGVGFVFRSLPRASAADGPHVAIVEPDHNNAKSWHYEPNDVTVKPGTTVVWDWQGTDKHSVTADDGSFDSGVKTGKGLRWEHRFDKPGDYNYSCTPHPTMTGVVHVR